MITTAPTFTEIMRPNFQGHTYGSVSGRYIVSFGQSVVIPQAELTADLLTETLFSLQERIESEGVADAAPGVWNDGGLLYFDSSRGFDDLEECLDFAKDNDQLAIYDTLEGEEIRLADLEQEYSDTRACGLCAAGEGAPLPFYAVVLVEDYDSLTVSGRCVACGCDLLDCVSYGVDLD